MTVDMYLLQERLLEFQSRRLKLRPLHLDDADFLYEATQNVHFNKHLLWRAPVSKETVVERVDSMLSLIDRGQMAVGVLVTKDTDDWVGLLKYVPLEGHRVEIGAWTHPRSWGQRHATEFAVLGPSIPLLVTDAYAVVGRSDADNVASIRLMQRAGMQFSHAFNSVGEDGVTRDSMEYILPRTHWQTLSHSSVEQE